MNTEPIDVTSILAQPEPFAQRLRQAERERDNLVAQLGQARGEIERISAELHTALAGWRQDQQRLAAVKAELSLAQATIDDMKAERAAMAAMSEELLAEVGRLTAAAERLINLHVRPDGTLLSRTSIVEGALLDLRAALRNYAPPARCTCTHYPDGEEPGEGAVMSLRDHACPIHGDPAQAGGRP